jgi:diacylglycerol O-acyltransferase
VGLADPSGGRSGNHYASVFVALPLGELAPDERLRRVARSLRAARSRGALGAAAHLAGASAAAGRWLERVAVRRFSRKASVVVSSVRGPGRPLHIGGALLRDAVVWAPAPGSVALAVTLMSYAGRVRVGILADECAIGDPAPLAAAVERGLGAPLDRA